MQVLVNRAILQTKTSVDLSAVKPGDQIKLDTPERPRNLSPFATVVAVGDNGDMVIDQSLNNRKTRRSIR